MNNSKFAAIWFLLVAILVGRDPRWEILVLVVASGCFGMIGLVEDWLRYRKDLEQALREKEIQVRRVCAPPKSE